MNWRIPILVAFLCFAVSPIALIAQEVFFEEDFGEGAQNWSVIQIVGNGASSGFWRTTTTGPAGVFALNPLNSTTAANGWVQFDSDLNCNPQGQDSWLVSPYIPTEGRTSIILSFETYYRTYNDRPQIRVGEAFTDYFTWDTYEIFPGLAVNDFGGETEGDPSLNPQYIQIDISPSVIGLDSFRFAFQFLSDATTFNGGTQGYGCAYSWQVDDVKLASVREISCGERVFEENFHSDASSYDYSECFSGPPIALPPYRDELYRFELADRQAVRVTLRDFSGSGMLSIMESDINNIPGPCAANNFLTQSLDEQEVIAVLNPGVYWIVVSGFEQGYYELAVDCFPADNPGMISCGQSLIGSTSDSPNTFSGSAYINCRGGLFAYGAGENRYQFTLSEAQAIVASLSSLGALDLDLFLFSNVNGQPGQCLDASYNLYADTREEIITPLPAGTYWLIVDGDTDPDAGQLGEGPFELSLNCFTDEGLSTISCGQTTTGNTAGQPNNLSAYFECFPNGTANVFGGGERLYRLDLEEEKEVVIRLESLGPDNLALFLLDNGPGNQPGPCRLIGEQLGFTDTVEILASLPAGNYWIAVDGAMFPAFPEDYIAEGPFRLSVDCYEDEGLMVISCGQSTFGSTLGRSSSYSDYSSCFTNGSDNYNAGDRLYRFEISQEQAVAIQLKNLSANNIDLFLMENAPGNQPGACIEKSVLPGEEREEILAKLNAGTYWIQIDGREEFDFFGNLIDAGESPFELTVKCFGLPSICDLEGIYISNGNTVFPELYSAREIPADNFLYIDQIPSSFIEPDAVLGDIFVYYHEGETDFFSLDLNAAAPSVRAFAFDCNTIYSDRSDACLGGTDAGGVLNVPGAGEGFYYIVVFNQEMAYYDLTVLPGGTCSMGEGQYFCFDTALPSNFAGQGNDFNTADDYSDCYSGPIAYDGEDIVVGFRIGGPDLPKQRVDRGLLTIGISLVADGPMGVFLFDYQCGENCLGYAEYSSPGQLVEFSFDDLNLDAGTFYLVLDEAFPGAVSDFSIICAPGVFLDDCNFVDPSHEISFSPFAGASLVDSLEEGVEVISISIDYDRNDNAFRDIFYFETFELSRSPDGSFFNAFISGAGINGFKKCGYEEDEKILYRAKLSNDFIAVFDAEYQDTLPPDITAAGRFNATGFGKSRVRRFVLDTISPAPKLFINRKRAALRGVFGQGRGPVSPVFLADLLVNANNRWVVDKGPNSSWYMVTPDIDTVPPFVTQITIEALEENLSTDPRIDTFQILSPSMEPIEVEVIQPPSPCFLNPIGLQANASDATCNTIADGAITVNATGGNGSLYYEWDQGIGAVENPIGLAPGEYILTVRDEVNCTLSDTITVAGPGPISFTQAQASPVTCNGGADGSIAITVQGGNGGFTYSWNGSAGTAEDPTGLTAGAYTVTVTDSEGCTALETVVINEPPAIELAVASATAVSCHGASDGSIAITAGGGTGALSYAWDNGVGAVEDPTGLAAGDYTLTVTDANGCTLEETITIGEPPAITITQLEA
ncbi:MAG: hypothetical protein J5I94_29215, partial [Phaeodactylibacter sp.]|nr:hypothetical protein [Phaeodactylibacter sp.]